MIINFITFLPQAAAFAAAKIFLNSKKEVKYNVPEEQLHLFIQSENTPTSIIDSISQYKIKSYWPESSVIFYIVACALQLVAFIALVKFYPNVALYVSLAALWSLFLHLKPHLAKISRPPFPNEDETSNPESNDQ